MVLLNFNIFVAFMNDDKHLLSTLYVSDDQVKAFQNTPIGKVTDFTLLAGFA